MHLIFFIVDQDYMLSILNIYLLSFYRLQTLAKWLFFLKRNNSFRPPKILQIFISLTQLRQIVLNNLKENPV